MSIDLDRLFDETDALGIGERVRAGDISAAEAVAAGLRRIARVEPQLQALCRPAAAPGEILRGGPFAGVPFVVKDLMADCAGSTTGVGAAFFADDPPAAADSAAVARMRRSGLGIVGRSKSSEFGLAPTTEPRCGGPVRNPWDPALSPGGSSGGSAALVAARALPMAHATDGGGSIRIPAALCGLFGLKPSRGRVSLAPLGETLAGAGAQHCVSLSVRDSAALLDALAGPEPGDPYGIAAPAGSFLDAARREPPRLRIALQRRPTGGPDPGPAVLGAVDEAASLFAGLGHDVEEARPDWSVEEIEAALFTVMAANTWTNIGNRAAGRPFDEADFEPVTWAFATAGRAMPAAEYIRAVQAFHRIGRRVGRFFERFDVLLTPTIARVSLALGAIRTDVALDAFRDSVVPMIAYTAVCNIAGIPAASLPLAWSDEGLPLGVQIAGRLGDEATLLALAAEAERARPWRGRRPPITA
ncbi:MAG TPA: amidase [Microvirga sp.]|jgi:Asp-tRNA(Asn)/Glu-tRNA(Gln) amidotransferase A subunit family amidase|nr:amidase [Microvirga sp.]